MLRVRTGQHNAIPNTGIVDNIAVAVGPKNAPAPTDTFELTEGVDPDHWVAAWSRQGGRSGSAASGSVSFEEIVADIQALETTQPNGPVPSPVFPN